jgi:NAD(P)-dependent dehydrogenase (short-subunit alcohol dehydrogenase family)
MGFAYYVGYTNRDNCSGLYTSLELAKHGARVYIAGRNEVAGKEAIKTIRTEAASADVRFLAVDLANLESVDACVKSFQE